MDLFLVSRIDIFSIYPKILKELLQAEENERLDEGELIKDFIHLPSDADFQERVYYRLLEIQKKINALLDSGVHLDEITATKAKSEWDPEISYSSSSASQSTRTSPQTPGSARQRICRQDKPIEYLDTHDFNKWDLEDFTKAGKLLRKPPLECTFFDEHEMRRVYSIVYDVFRYKHILSQALHDVGFFEQFPDLVKEKNRLWLLLHDLYLRHFLRREPADRLKQKYLYKDADLEKIHESVWKFRIHLAASISRLRIQNSALQLSDLLPIHLQDEKVAIAAANPIVTGWMNPFKMRTKNGARQCMVGNGFAELEDTEGGEQRLDYSYFKWDKVCPLFLSCIPMDRSQFAKSELIKKGQFIMQDRSFSLGPAIFSRLLEYFELEGDVVQTHVLSPRSTAYLAALFYCSNRDIKLIAFGAGTRLDEYKQFFDELGCYNVKIFAENFCKVPLDSPVMEKVVGIFVTPPNSYSSVTDPIDLICSRGGDLAMLKILTESELSDESKQRVAKILEQQRESLRLAMSRPQVQYLLYETHSVVDSENEQMVKKSIENVNDSAYIKHLKLYKERKKLEAIAEQEGITNEQLAALQGGGSSVMKKKARSEEVTKKIVYDSDGSSTDFESETELVETPRSRIPKSKFSIEPEQEDERFYLKVPKTDRFETVDVPDFCSNQDKCIDFKEHGCFLSLVKRKGLSRMDEKYLIAMAEKRGLFGDSGLKKGKSRPQTRSSKREEKHRTINKKPKKKKNEDISDLLDRISKPTYASRKRDQTPTKSSFNAKMLIHSPKKCKCHWPSSEEISDTTTSYSSGAEAQPKRWWKATSRFIRSLDLLKIPEIERSEQIFESIRSKKILPLILPRFLPKIERNKDPYPLSTSNLQFAEYRDPSFANIPNIPIMMDDMKKYPLSVSRPSFQKFKPLGLVNIKDVFFL